MRRRRNILAIILIIILSIIFCFCLFFYVSITPVTSFSNKIKVDIKEGSSTRNVLKTLESEMIIKNSDCALIYSKLFNEPSFKAGVFELDSSWGLDKIFNYLSDDRNVIQLTVDFTIFPGSTIRMIASNLQEYTNLNANELIQKWNDPDYLELLKNDYSFLTDELFNEEIVMKLEGYFFPDTYNLFKETSIDTVTRIFLNNTQRYFDKYSEKFSNSNYSVNEIFTLASIIDYEGNTAEDRKNISSVFYNRLSVGMPLQSSVTRCYAISLKENRNITEWSECEIELDFDSPYDTYQHYGLPPGPIRCISETSLQAALEPNNTNYYFFIGDVCGDGTVYFSENYSQHNNLISEFLTKCQ